MNIAIYIFDNAEVLDFSGPFEVFATASRFLPEESKFKVFLLAENNSAVLARGGYSVNPSYNFSNHPAIDVLIVVGGVHDDEMRKENVITWIKAQALSAKVIASVCTGAFLLAEANLLTGLSVTTHWQDTDDLQQQFPDLNVVTNVRWVDEGKVVTSAGISAGIDMSLHLVEKLKNKNLAEQTAKQMQFSWTENS
ncbi:DJ-1/PfpI family protein [Colwelliaceae bacterium BS250]